MMVLTLTVSACALPAFAAEVQGNAVGVQAETPATDFVYTVLSDGTAEIAGYTGNDTDINIPSTIDGRKVTSIGNSAFFKNSSLKSITIPSGVAKIGNYAFSYCDSLESVTIPSSVTSIGQNAFSNNSSDLSIDCFTGTAAAKYVEQNGIKHARYSYNVLGDGTAEIRTFSGNETEVIIPSYVDGRLVTAIGNTAFIYSNLKSVVIPDSVTKIGDYAFCQCCSLTSIKLPERLTYLGEYAFGYCSMKSITIPEGIEWIGVFAFGKCSSLTTVTVPDGVEFICDYAFYNCNSLSDIIIPKSVTYVCNNAFEGCAGSLVIHGCTGSYAQKFAEQNGIGFISSDIAK